MFKPCDGNYHEEVGDEQFDDAHRGSDSIDHRERDDNKEISHLPDRHGIGAIPHDAEDTEKSDTYTDARLGLQVFEHENHEEHEEEDCYRREHKGEIEVSPLAFAVIESVNDEEVDTKTN